DGPAFRSGSPSRQIDFRGGPRGRLEETSQGEPSMVSQSRRRRLCRFFHRSEGHIERLVTARPLGPSNSFVVEVLFADRFGHCRESFMRLTRFTLQCHMELMSKIRTICVYCGSGAGTNHRFIESAKAFGKVLAENGIRLVYGGGSVGMMGAVASSVLEHG